MQLAIKCLIGLAVFASPCAWDTNPKDAAADAAILAGLSPARAQISRTSAAGFSLEAMNSGTAAKPQVALEAADFLQPSSY